MASPPTTTPPPTLDTARTTAAPASLAFCVAEGRSGWVIATARPQAFVTLDWPLDGRGRAPALITAFGRAASVVPMPGSYFQLSQYADDWSQEGALPGFIGVVGEKIFLRAVEAVADRYEGRWVDLATGDIIAEDLDVAICCRVWSLKVPVGVEDAVLHTFGGR